MSAEWSRDAEQAILGALMISDAAYYRVADQITEADFFSPDHRTVWRCIAELAKRNEVRDAVTVGELLEREGRPDLMTMVLSAADSTPGAGNVVGYAKIVTQHAELRRIRAAGREIAGLDSDRVADAPAILAAAQSSRGGQLVGMGDALKSWYADLTARYERGDALSGLSTGLADLDALTHGLQAGDLIIVGARPSMGKTAFALHLIRACGSAGGRALVFSIEMPTRALADRMVSSVARVSSDVMRSPAEIDQEAWPRITAAIKQIGEWEITFDESGSISADAICARARQQHAKGALSLVVIDYLQLIQMRGDNRNDSISEVTRALKLLAKSLGVPLVLLSQLNRSLEARSDKRPMMSDLRESGAIEQDADVIAFLYRDEVYDRQSRDKGYTEIIIAKHRNGATGVVAARSELMFGRYSDAHEGLPSASAEQESSQPTRFRRRQSNQSEAA